MHPQSITPADRLRATVRDFLVHYEAEAAGKRAILELRRIELQAGVARLLDGEGRDHGIRRHRLLPARSNPSEPVFHDAIRARMAGRRAAPSAANRLMLADDAVDAAQAHVAECCRQLGIANRKPRAYRRRWRSDALIELNAARAVLRRQRTRAGIARADAIALTAATESASAWRAAA